VLLAIRPYLKKYSEQGDTAEIQASLEPAQLLL
jgi:hypothetical protein